MKNLLLLLGLVFVFTAFSGSFLKVETEDFDILFENGLQEQAYILKKEGPEIYRRLTGFYGITLTKRLRVYLQDSNDYGNAYADFFSNAIFIYINRVEASFLNNTYQWWTSFVFSHELTHILVANKPFWFKSFLNLFGRPVSAFFDSAFSSSYLHEGLSIFSESMLFEEGRFHDSLFDMYLRKDIYENDFYGLSLAGGVSSTVFNPVGMNYLYGANFFKFLSDKYGNVVVSKVLVSMSEHWLSLKKALEALTGKSFHTLLVEWENWSQEKAFSLISEKTFLEGINLSVSGYYTGKPKTNGRNLYYFSQSKKGTVFVRTDSDGKEDRWEIPMPSDYDVSPSGRLAMVYAVGDGLEYFTRNLYLGEWKSTIRKVPQSERVTCIQWKDDNSLFIVSLENGGTTLWFFDTRNEKKTRLISGTPDFYINSFEYVEKYTDGNPALLCSITFDKQVRIYHIGINSEISEGTIMLSNWEMVGSASSNSLTPFYHEGSVYYANDEGGIYNVYRWETLTGETEKITSVKTGAFRPVLFNGSIYYDGYGKEGFDVYCFALSGNREASDTIRINTVYPAEPFSYADFKGENDTFYDDPEILSARVVYPLPLPRIWLPLPLLTPGGVGGFGGAAGWDDLKEWIWIFNAFYLPESELLEPLGLPLWSAGIDLIKRGDLPFTTSFYVTSESINGSFSFEKSLINRINQDILRIIPSFSLGFTRLIDPQWDFKWEYYQDIGTVGNALNTVSVPKFFQIITNNPSMGFRSGVGFKFPFSGVGMVNVSVRETTVYAGVESWIPIPLRAAGTENGKYRFNGLTFHAGAYLTNESTLFQLISGIQLDFGLQYWLNMKIGLDLVVQKGKIEPKISFNFTDVSFNENMKDERKKMVFSSLLQ
jgi:hypothetical protein